MKAFVVMMFCAFGISAQAFAWTWETNFIGYGCGDSEAEAARAAIEEAQAEAKSLERDCARDEGVYSEHYYQMGSCHSDGSDFFCRVSCSQMGTSTCEIN